MMSLPKPVTYKQVCVRIWSLKSFRIRVNEARKYLAHLLEGLTRQTHHSDLTKARAQLAHHASVRLRKRLISRGQ